MSEGMLAGLKCHGHGKDGCQAHMKGRQRRRPAVSHMLVTKKRQATFPVSSADISKSYAWCLTSVEHFHICICISRHWPLQRSGLSYAQGAGLFNAQDTTELLAAHSCARTRHKYICTRAGAAAAARAAHAASATTAAAAFAMLAPTLIGVGLPRGWPAARAAAPALYGAALRLLPASAQQWFGDLRR